MARNKTKVGTAAEWEKLWGAYIDALKAKGNVEATREALIRFDRRNGHDSMSCYAKEE